MATNQQISPEQMRQLRAQQALSSQNEIAPSEAVYDQSTTEGQIKSTRQQLEQARAPAEQFVKQYIYPQRRERAFTPRQQRAQILATGEVAKTQLAEVSSSQQTFEREVATKAPEYALPQFKAQALSEAKATIQANIDRIQAKIDNYKERIKYYEDKHRKTGKDYNDTIQEYEDKIDVVTSELRGWKEGIGGNENDIIKKYFSGYTSSKANYYANRTESNINAQNTYSQLLNTPDFQNTLSSLGLSPNASLSQYQSAVTRYNKNLAYENQLIKLANQKGFENLSSDLQKQLVTRGLVTGVDSGFKSMNAPGYYNPKTGELVSMKPEDAVRLGYQRVTTTGFNPQTGQYVIKSETGLLTPRQLEIKNIIERTPSSAILFGGAKPSEMQSVKMPTEFIVGGEQKATLPTLPQFMALPKSAYEIAQRQAPYSQKEMLEMTKVTEKLMQVPMKFGGTKLVPATEGYTGKVFTRVSYEDGSSRLITPEGKEFYTPAYEGSKAQKIESGIAKAGTILGGTMVTAIAPLKGVGLIFGDKITDFVTTTTSKLIPVQDTGFSLKGAPAQIGRGVIFYALSANPTVATAFVTQIAKSAATDAKGTVNEIWNYFKKNPYEVASGFVAGGVHLRVRELIARQRIYNEVNTKLVNEYGKNSVEVKDFQTAWKRAFKELPKQVPLTKPFSVEQLKAISGDAKAIKIVNEVLKKYSPEIIGTSVILPQTKLKTPPRGKFGDIDVQNVRGVWFKDYSKKLANEIYTRMQQAGYNVKLQEGDFMGFKKYYLTLDGDEFINIGTSSKYFLETQAGPLRDLLEAEKFRQFTRDPITGALIGNIRSQLRVKIVKGYTGADISMIRKISDLYKAGKIDAVNELLKKLKGREKDIVDALGIVKGTDYLINEGKYIGPKAKKPTVAEVVRSMKERTVGLVTDNVRKINSLLTEKGGERVGYAAGKYAEKYKPKPYKEEYKKSKYEPNKYLVSYKPTYKPAKYKPSYKPTGYKPSYKPTPKSVYNPLIPSKYTPSKYEKLTPKPPKVPYKAQPKYERALSSFGRLIVPTPEKKLKGKKAPKKKPTGYQLTPTITQKLYKIKRKGGPSRRPRGFEIARL